MLIKCEECGQVVSDRAQSCPHCGAPVPLSNDRPSGIVVSEDDHRTESIVCPQCGTGYGIIEAKCPKCGYENIVIEKVFDTRMGVQVSNKRPAKRKCPDCGYEYDLLADHCPKCGSMNVPFRVLGFVGGIISAIILAVIIEGC